MPIDPRGVSFERWSAMTASAIATVGYVPSEGDEKDWQAWAFSAIHVPALAGLGVPDPRQFASWQDWAVRLNDGLRTIGL